MSETQTSEITIRRAHDADVGALNRLAGLDSQRLPDDEFMIGEVGGEAWAAVGIATGTVLADPFRPTAELAQLVAIRAARLRRPAPGLGRALRRLRRRAA
jgi:hypothetical protein